MDRRRAALDADALLGPGVHEGRPVMTHAGRHVQRSGACLAPRGRQYGRPTPPDVVPRRTEPSHSGRPGRPRKVVPVDTTFRLRSSTCRRLVRTLAPGRGPDHRSLSRCRSSRSADTAAAAPAAVRTGQERDLSGDGDIVQVEPATLARHTQSLGGPTFDFGPGFSRDGRVSFCAGRRRMRQAGLWFTRRVADGSRLRRECQLTPGMPALDGGPVAAELADLTIAFLTASRRSRSGARCRQCRWEPAWSSVTIGRPVSPGWLAAPAW